MFARNYAGDRPLDDPSVSPLNADLAGLPPLKIVAGEQEILIDDSRALTKVAQDAGVEVSLEVEPHEVHAFPLFVDVNRRAHAAVLRMGAFARGVVK